MRSVTERSEKNNLVDFVQRKHTRAESGLGRVADAYLAAIGGR